MSPTNNKKPHLAKLYRLPYEVDINFSVATAGVKYFGLSLYNHATRLDVGFEVMNKAEMALREREDKIKELKKAYKRVIRKMNKQIENAKQDEDFVQKATAIVAEEVEAFRKSHQLSPYAEQVHTAGNFVPMLTDGIIGAFLYPSEDMIRKSAKDAVMNYIART